MDSSSLLTLRIFKAFASPSTAEWTFLAHAPDMIGGIDTTLVEQLVAHHMKMIPTLKLFSGSSHIDLIRKIVAQFHADKGTLLFGTDTGFLTDYDVTEEYHQLALTGLSFHDVLAML